MGLNKMGEKNIIEEELEKVKKNNKCAHRASTLNYGFYFPLSLRE